MRIFTKRHSLASHAIEILCEIDRPIKFPNFQIFSEKSNRCKDHRKEHIVLCRFAHTVQELTYIDVKVQEIDRVVKKLNSKSTSQYLRSTLSW